MLVKQLVPVYKNANNQWVIGKKTLAHFMRYVLAGSHCRPRRLAVFRKYRVDQMDNKNLKERS